MYCKFLKLSNGDDIILTTEDNYETFKDKEFVSGKNVVQVGVIRLPRSGGLVESYILQPWIRMAKTEEVNIPVNSVIAMVDIDEKAARQYLSFVKEKTPLTLESCSEEKLERELEEPLEFEEEEYDDQPTTNRGYTIH